MATITLGGTPTHTVGELPAVGAPAPAFTVTDADVQDVSSADLGGTRVVLSIFPSVGTGVCAASERRFNELAAGLEDTRVVSVSMDLPFALSSFCAGEGIENVTATSAFRSTFGTDYGVLITDGKFAGLLARAIVVLDRDGTVLHTELVPEIAQEPDYDAAVAALS
jgi:thiol peroxidase